MKLQVNLQKGENVGNWRSLHCRQSGIQLKNLNRLLMSENINGIIPGSFCSLKNNREQCN